jgi:hypothetical protein
MFAHSETVVRKFCEISQSTYDAWRKHRILFHKNPREAELIKSPAGKTLIRLSIITQEYFLHQVSKLHDPAVQKDQVNLGIDYIVRFGGWDEMVKAKLQLLQKQLEELPKKIRPARNKILFYNDLETYLNEPTLGAFPDEADTEYFKALEEFVNVVHENAIGTQWQFSRDVDAESQLLLSSLK